MWYSIATVDNDTAIVERLKDIEKILTDGVNAIRTYQESNKELKVGPLRAEIAFDPQSKEDNQTEANRQYATQEGIRKTAIAAFCIGFLFAGFAFAQLLEMRTQTGQIFHQSEIENASASLAAVQWLEQFKVGQDQAHAAQQDVAAFNKQTLLDERAWVSMDVGEKDGNFFVAMHNTGKTPAINATYVTGFAAANRGAPPRMDFSQNSSSPVDTRNLPPSIIEELRKQGVIPSHPPTGYVIAPGKSEIASYYGRPFQGVFGFPQDKTMYIQGRITYDDIFGGKHETRFCYWYASPGTFPMCNDHNYVN